MKKLIALFSIAGMLTFGICNTISAQDTTTAQAQTEQTTAVAPAQSLTPPPAEGKTFHQVLKEKFIEGGVTWMTPILIVLILGLALTIERIIYLNLSSTDTRKLLQKVENSLDAEGIEAAKEVCKNTRGPVAGVFFQGLDRFNEGLDVVEKSVVSYGGVLMSKLENNLSWITLFIAIAPMLGFLGTVIGMVEAFDAIEAAGDISPTVVAGGMKIALLTTVFGLIVALILQVFYNYLLTKVESIVNDMEDSTISFMDILVRYKNTKK